MTISQIYTHYKIPPGLQQHMLRVAAVGNTIASNWKEQKMIEINTITRALLIHDMGNIMLFNFEKFPMENEEYWKAVQKEFKEKYKDEHEATIHIARETGLDEKGIKVLEQMPEINGKNHVPDGLWELAICWYSDFRVTPKKITSFEERMDDLIKRRKMIHAPANEIDRLEGIKQYGQVLEAELQRYVTIDLADITDELTAKKVDELKNFLF